MIESAAEVPPVLYLNDETPPGFTNSAGPTRLAVGRLGSGTSMEQVAALLVENGVSEDRIHFLSGKDGVAFLDQVGNWFARMLSDARTDAKNYLQHGEVIVGVFDVESDDVGRIRDLLRDAGIVHASYYGKWTNLD